MAQQYTKKNIQKSFITLLNQYPLNKITVKRIAEECKINRNTFYYYYTDTYEVLEELFQSELQLVLDAYNDTLSWEESFLAATSFALENKTAIYHVYHSIQRESLRDYIFQVAGNVMFQYVDKIAQDIPTQASDKKLIAYFYQCALTEMVLRWIATNMEEDPNKMIRKIGNLFDGNILASLKRSAQA